MILIRGGLNHYLRGEGIIARISGKKIWGPLPSLVPLEIVQKAEIPISYLFKKYKFTKSSSPTFYL